MIYFCVSWATVASEKPLFSWHQCGPALTSLCWELHTSQEQGKPLKGINRRGTGCTGFGARDDLERSGFRIFWVKATQKPQLGTKTSMQFLEAAAQNKPLSLTRHEQSASVDEMQHITSQPKLELEVVFWCHVDAEHQKQTTSNWVKNFKWHENWRHTVWSSWQITYRSLTLYWHCSIWHMCREN